MSAEDRDGDREDKREDEREPPAAERLPDHVLGTLSDQELREVDQELARSPSLRRQRDEIAEALSDAAASALAPVPAPPPGPRDRLMATLAGPDRFAPFMPDLVRLFELPEPAMRELLARADRTAAGWETSLQGVELAGTELFHFAAGPGLAASGAAAGFLRMRPGARFPAHSHDGEESTYVLEGGYQTGSRIYGPGSLLTMKAGSRHDYAAAPERPLLIVVLHRGVSFAHR